MNIEPYQSFDSLRFGKSTQEDCVARYGEPNRIRMNRENVEEYHYGHFIVRFDPSTKVIRECTLLPMATATIADIEVTWDREFLFKACERDGSPMNLYGFIVLNKLGIAVTGIHDRDESQRAVTVFSMGDFDDLLTDANPFECTSLRSDPPPQLST